MKIKLKGMVWAVVFAAASTQAAVESITNTFTGSSSIDSWYNIGSVHATIAYSSGAGPRWDYWDGDDDVAQTAKESSESNDVVAAGGVITGDGLLADGALWFDTTDGTSGNEYIAYTLGGVMEEGEEIIFTYHVFNNNDYYSYTQGQLWDMTTTNVLAVAGATPQNANGWTIVKANSAVDYQPYSWHVSYTATAAEEGHQLAIVFREWDNSNHRDSYIDNIAVTSHPQRPIAGITNTFSSASDIQGWFNMGPANAVISHLPAGSRKDYWDGDDSAAQPTRTSSESNDVVAAGGTLTGDGLLADGALWFDVQDSTQGNESIAYVLDGEMAEGDVINFSYNDFNNASYYNMVQGQLWDMTTSNQLAVANWVTVQAYSAANYRPYNAAVSYVATSVEAGHKLGIVFREWGNSNHRDPYIDNVRVTIAADNPDRAYQRWAAGFGLTGSDYSCTADPDGDLLSNLGEYGVGGDPTDSANQGVMPTGSIGEKNGTNWFDYVYPRRPDFWLAGLDYHVETRTNLLEGVDWTNGMFSVVESGEGGDGLDRVTNRIPIFGESSRFARLAIDEPGVRPIASDPLPSREEDIVLFHHGDADVHTYRIPGIITATNGDLVVVGDARENSADDMNASTGIDIVCKRSTDNGATWTAMAKLTNYGYKENASDASLVLDRSTGEIFCFYSFMDRNTADGEYRLHVRRSTDNGATWGAATDITAQIAGDSGWDTDKKFIVSGRGIQLRDGRLMHTMVNTSEGLFVFGSDDHGATWSRYGVPIPPGMANESKLVELNDGAWMVNSRTGDGYRWVHISEDEGQSWSSLPDPNLAEYGANSSIIRYTSVRDGYARNRLLFSNANYDLGDRRNMAVRISYDEGKSWSEGKVVDDYRCMYSSMTICADGSIGIFYYDTYVGLRFVRFTLEQLTDGKDALSVPYQL